MDDAAYFEDFYKFIDKKGKRDFYDQYADKYDDVMIRTNYTPIQNITANLLKNCIADESAIILDVSCGTGSSGAALQRAGFKIIHGSDASAKMLKLAEEKRIYSKLFTGLITSENKIDCGDDEYDGVSCIGAVAKGHIELKDALGEFCRITKIGGYAAFTIVDIEGFMATLGEFMAAKKIELISLQQKFFVNTIDKSFYCHTCVIQVL